MDNSAWAIFIGDDELLEILLASNFKTLIRLCQSSISAYNICQNNNFWLNKLHIDYPNIYDNYTILISKSSYALNVYNYMKNNTKVFYKSVVDFYECANTSNKYMMNFIYTLHGLSSENINITIFINLLLLIKYDESLEERLHINNINLYSGTIIISALLPKDFMFNSGSVTIIDGILINGILNKFVISKIITALAKNYGSNVAQKFETTITCISSIYLSNYKVGMTE